MLVLAMRASLQLLDENLQPQIADDAALVFPANLGGSYRDIFNERDLTLNQAEIALSTFFSDRPFALLLSQTV